MESEIRAQKELEKELEIQHKISKYLEGMNKLSDEGLKMWTNQYKKRKHAHPLDVLYEQYKNDEYMGEVING